jgi:hypothetical protein
MTKKFRIWDKELKIYTEHAELRDGILEDILLHPKGGFLLIRDNGLTKVLDENRFVLEQFTGILDKNGREIYEGDILEYSSSDPRFKRVIVKWTNEDHDNHPGFIISDSYSQYGKPKIIGNIHENNA